MWGVAGGGDRDPPEPGGDGRQPCPGRIDRAQMLAATRRVNIRLSEIEAEVESAARENVLTPLVAAENAASAWECPDLSRKRTVIRTLMTITLGSPGRGARRVFDPATVQVSWRPES